MNEEDVKGVISATIHEMHMDNSINFSKPKTIQGWLYIIGFIGGAVAFIFTGIVKLNDIASHAEAPHHEGVEILVNKFQDEMLKHGDDQDVHRTEAELELLLIKETEPIKEKVNSIQNDVRSIQRSVDILVEDNRRKNDT